MFSQSISGRLSSVTNLFVCLFVCFFFVYLQSAEQVTLFCRQQIEYSDDEEPKPSIHLSQAQKLRKVIIELVNTERSYVKVMHGSILPVTIPPGQPRGQVQPFSPGGGELFEAVLSRGEGGVVL